MKPVLMLFLVLKLICAASAGESETPPAPSIAPSPLKRVFDKDHHGHDHNHNHAHSSGDHANHIHFDHPILTEVPTPHNVISFGYAHTRSSEKTHTDSFELGFEYAPVKWFSFEVATPVEALNPDEGRFTSGVGSTEFAFTSKRKASCSRPAWNSPCRPATTTRTSAATTKSKSNRSCRSAGSTTNWNSYRSSVTACR